MEIAVALFLSKFHEPRCAFSMKMKHKEPKDKQISSHCISFNATCFWRWKLKSCPRTAISVDHRHRSHHYCRAHIQSWVASRLGSQVDFPHYMTERERRWCVQFYVNNTGCSPSLSGRLLQVHVIQWAPIVRNINLHRWHGGWNKTLSEPQCEPERAKHEMWLWTAISSSGVLFLWWEK